GARRAARAEKDDGDDCDSARSHGDELFVVEARLRAGDDAGDVWIFLSVASGDGVRAALALDRALGPARRLLLLLLALGLLAVALVDARSLRRWHAGSSLSRSTSLHPTSGCADG